MIETQVVSVINEDDDSVLEDTISDWNYIGESYPLSSTGIRRHYKWLKRHRAFRPRSISPVVLEDTISDWNLHMCSRCCPGPDRIRRHYKWLKHEVTNRLADGTVVLEDTISDWNFGWWRILRMGISVLEDTISDWNLLRPVRSRAGGAVLEDTISDWNDTKNVVDERRRTY